MDGARTTPDPPRDGGTTGGARDADPAGRDRAVPPGQRDTTADAEPHERAAAADAEPHNSEAASDTPAAWIGPSATSLGRDGVGPAETTAADIVTGDAVTMSSSEEGLPDIASSTRPAQVAPSQDGFTGDEGLPGSSTDAATAGQALRPAATAAIRPDGAVAFEATGAHAPVGTAPAPTATDASSVVRAPAGATSDVAPPDSSSPGVPGPGSSPSVPAAATANGGEAAGVRALDVEAVALTAAGQQRPPVASISDDDSGARGEAIRSMAAALRQGRGDAPDVRDPSARLEIFGHELRRAIEAALPSFEAPGRAQAAWLRTLGALAEADRSAMPLPGAGPDAPTTVHVAGPVASATVYGTMSGPLPAGRSDFAPPGQFADAEVGQQILQGLRVQWRTGAGEARIHLQPDHLGAVDVALRVSDGEVRAVVRAESPAVQEWIARHRDDLKAALDAQGLTLEELDVVVDPDDRRRRAPGEAEPRRVVRRNTGAAAEERLFEVRV